MKKVNLTSEQKEANKLARKQARMETNELARITAERDQPPVNSIIISIEWKKSRTWGSNPRAMAEVNFMDKNSGPWKTGFYRADGYTCSGCGYDKESTVIGEIFNDFLRYKLWALSDEAIKGGNGSGDNGSAPYGIHNYNLNSRSYGQGIGTSCYYRIAEYIGGSFEHIASGKTFDVYKYTDIHSI